MHDKRAKSLVRTGWRPTAFAKATQNIDFHPEVARSRLRPTKAGVDIPRGPAKEVTHVESHGSHSPMTLTQLNNREFHRAQTADRVASPLVQMMPGATDAERRAALTNVKLKSPSARTQEMSDQRYIMSPLEHTKNLFDNAYGMALHSQTVGKNIVQPVFMHHPQRQSFAKRVEDKRQEYAADMVEIGPMSKDATKQGYYKKRQALNDLREASSLAGAKMSLQGLEKAVTYTQGHGSAGVRSISSDSEYLTLAQAQKWQQENPRVSYSKITDASHAHYGKYEAHETVTDKQTASSLHAMDISDSMVLRANSCFSGTENNLWAPQAHMIVDKFFKDELIQHTGKWDNTYAGGLQDELNQQRRGVASGVKASSLQRPAPMSVTGYIGPTTQGAIPSYKRDKSIGVHFAVVMPFTHDDMGYKMKDHAQVPMRRSESSRRVLPKTDV